MEGSCGVLVEYISGIFNQWAVLLDRDKKSHAVYVKPSQCKRLKPKRKQREYWIHLYESKNAAVYSHETSGRCVDSDPDFIKCVHVVHVREVLEPKVKK